MSGAELPAAAPAATGAQPWREGLYRDGAVALGVLLMSLAATAALPWEHDRSVLEEIARRPETLVAALPHFGLPLAAGAATLWTRMRGRTPGAVGAGLLLLPMALVLLVMLLATAATLLRSRWHVEAGVILVAVLVFVALEALMLRRARRREGWERWSLLLAAVLPWHLLIGGLFASSAWQGVATAGLRLYIGVVAALLPVGAWVCWPRRS